MSAEEWTESRLESLIQNQVQESLHLDYKRSSALDNTERNKNEISKDVSAFANSDGGTIIYGIEEEERDHLPVRIDGGVPAEGKREWLEQVINSRIHPKIEGVRIHQVNLSLNPGNAVFVVEIPVGFTAHQAHDHRYYRRYNFQSVPMRDYEVKMVMNRFREPILELNVPREGEWRYIDEELLLPLEIENKGKVSAQSALIELYVPASINPRSEGRWKARSPMQYNDMRVQPFDLFLGLPHNPPIYPGRRFSISGSDIPDKILVNIVEKLIAQSFTEPFRFPIFYEIFAADMAPRKGKIVLEISGGDVRFIRE